MSEEGKLINIGDLKVDLGNVGDLSNPMHAFVNRIAEAVGGFAKPYQISRVAKAESRAAILRAKTKVQISEIEERGLRRMVFEEGTKQENIEAITKKALPYIKDDAHPNSVEKDFFVDFFDKCRLVSNAEMQEVWAKVLAQEGNNPGSISKRTVALIASLDKKDAELFTKFCRFVWQIGDLVPFVFEVSSGVPFSEGITFDSLKHLDSIGLISFESVTGYIRQNLPKCATISYYGRRLTIEFPEETNNLEFGKVLLTEAGQQLAKICGSSPSEDHYSEVIQRLFDSGYALSSHVGNKSF